MNKVKVVNVILVAVFLLAFSFVAMKTFLPTEAFAKQASACSATYMLCGDKVIIYCFNEPGWGSGCGPCGGGC